MLVRNRMTHEPITVTEDTAVDKALEMMREADVRRFPVLNKRGKLVGMVAEKDLLYASPSPATSLSIYEIAYLLSKIKVGDVMTHDVISVTADTPLEEAARIMVDNEVSGLPVLDEGKLVGIITETDMFRIFLEMFGARESGVRVSLLVPEGKGVLAKITTRVADIGGNIVSLGTLLGDDPSNRDITLRVNDVSEETLVTALEGLGLDIRILDVRFCPLPTCE